MINDTQCDVFAERLADLLEREIDESARAALEAHALACADCGALLSDLRTLRIDAANLPTLAPSRDLWDGIAKRIDAPVIPLHAGAGIAEGGVVPVSRWRRWTSMSAAAALLMAVTAASTYYLTIRAHAAGSPATVATRPSVVADTGRAVAPERGPVQTVAVADSGRKAVPASTQRERTGGSTPVASVRLVSAKPSAEQVYASEIARLHTIVERRRAQLDPVTIGVIERNLKVIDDAIAQCRLALTKDPASRFLMESLNNALENKVQLLRTATMLPARS